MYWVVSIGSLYPVYTVVDALFVPSRFVVLYLLCVTAIVPYFYAASVGYGVTRSNGIDLNEIRSNTFMVSVPFIAALTFWVVPAVYFNYISPSGGFDLLPGGFGGLALAVVLGILFGIPYLVILVVLPFFLVIGISFSVYYLAFGVYAMVVTTPDLEAAKRHTALRRPNSAVFADLKNARVNGLAFDGRVQNLLHELHPATRWFHMIRYRILKWKYRKVADLQSEQIDHNRVRDEVGLRAVELERERIRKTYTPGMQCPICDGIGQVNKQQGTRLVEATCGACNGKGTL